ncbi:MAG: SulP family inorganic anion transporter [Alphaproteobacteria bacterium]
MGAGEGATAGSGKKNGKAASSFLPGLLPIDRERLARDVLAGLTLASINIPQLLGYTRIAGTPLVTGLYTAFLPAIAFALLGSSRHLVVAADSATAAILADSLSQMATPESGRYMTLVAVLALAVAALLLLARLFRLGFLADFLSRTVLVGFLAGVGVQVAVAMLSEMLRLHVDSRQPLVQMREIARSIGDTHLPSLALATGVAVAVLLARRFAPRFPASLLAVVGSTAASWRWDLSGLGFRVVGPIAGGLPLLELRPLAWSDVLAVLPVALSCATIIIAQSAAAARAMAFAHHERDDVNADILGLAAANVAASISGASVVNGSPTQTAVADRAGSTSQWSQLTLAAVVLVVLLFLTGPLSFLPRCVLAAIVFTIGAGMIDVRRLLDMRTESPGEFRVSLATAATVALVGVEQGVLLAVVLSLLRHVRHSYLPHTAMLVEGPDGRRESVRAEPGLQTAPGLIVYGFGSDLFYANENRFAEEVRELVAAAPDPVRWLVVDAGAITDLDYSAARSLRERVLELDAQGISIAFGRVTRYLRADMVRHGLVDALGEDHVFPSLHQALALAEPGRASLAAAPADGIEDGDSDRTTRE